MPSSHEVTRLLHDLHQGNQDAVAQLMPLIYDELHRLAIHYMRQERPGHTLQATALVHEAFLRMVDQKQPDFQSRTHFVAVAAQVMRRLLIDHARARRAAKRGGLQHKVPLEDKLVLSEQQSEEVLALDEALGRLAVIDPRQSRIVELHYFGGLSMEEIAGVVGISSRTVKRDWAVARAWLHRELTAAGHGPAINAATAG